MILARCLGLLALVLALHVPGGLTAAEAPFIDARAVKERWSDVTPADMAVLRETRVLVGSKSIGLNLVKGLAIVGKDDPAFNLVGNFARFDVEKNGGLDAIPGDAFASTRFVHFMATRHPYIKRMEELDRLLRTPPWRFGEQPLVATILYAEVDPESFPAYKDLVAGLRRDFPQVRILHATTSIFAANSTLAESRREKMREFNKLLRAEYKGREPIYDLEAILSDDFRDGAVMCSEYTKDPTGVHPNLDPGMRVMGRGYILALRDTLRWSADAPPLPPGKPAARIAGTETLAPDHPEYRAVRAILDRNGLRASTVEGHIQVRDGHVVGLFIQEAGVTVIPDEIGRLAKLERLTCYGDRTLGQPFLRSISPEIGKCTALRELLLNHNDLTDLPAEITALTGLETLSLADNRLGELSAPVRTWAARFDPQGLTRQTHSRP